MLFCRDKATYAALLQEFMDALVDSEDEGSECLRSTRETFRVTSTHAEDNYRTYTLSAPEVALLLERTKLPAAGLAAFRRTCATDRCCNAGHYERVRAPAERRSRIDHATSVATYFPPSLLVPVNPRGHAARGARNRRSTIPNEVAAEVLRLRYAEGLTYRSISERLGLKQAAVLSICVGRSKRALAQSLLPDLVAGARANGLLPPDDTETGEAAEPCAAAR